MDKKRSNSALWKILVDDEEEVSAVQERVVAHYRSLSRRDRDTYAPLRRIELDQQFDYATLDFYLRIRHGQSVWGFVEPYVIDGSDELRFRTVSVDTCLFIALERALFAVTSGAGYAIIDDYADYAFPFEVAKKLIANNFRATDVRSIAGATTSRTEIYRRGQSIGASDAFGKVWKRLVSKLNSELLPDGSYLRKLVDPARPPTIEVKSSFVLRKSLDLRQLVSVAAELDGLPVPSPDQKRELTFLDNLYQVKNSSLRDELKRQLIESVRVAVATGSEPDIDVCDPDDVSRYYAGSNFKLSYWEIDANPPDWSDVRDIVGHACIDSLTNPDQFYDKFNSLHLSYPTDSDGGPSVRKELYKFLHGQVEYEGLTYFLLDKIWYRVQGEFLENLRRDFVEETFEGSSPIFLDVDLGLADWCEDDEDLFNRNQAQRPGIYYGDKIFAISNVGKVELFDLLRVDERNSRLYVMHVKDGFNAKMRDACSQISMSADVIEQDAKGDFSVLRRYYQDWRLGGTDRQRRVSEETFLSWFRFDIVYVVLVSTRVAFAPEAFTRGALTSHIARRETLATRNEFRSNGYVFRLAHTRRV